MSIVQVSSNTARLKYDLPRKTFSSPSVFPSFSPFFPLSPFFFFFLIRVGIRGHKVLKAKTFCCWRQTSSLTCDGQHHFFALAANWCQLLLLIVCGPCQPLTDETRSRRSLSSTVTLLVSVTPLPRCVSVTLCLRVTNQRIRGVERCLYWLWRIREAVASSVAYVTSSPGQPSPGEGVDVIFAKYSLFRDRIHCCHYVLESHV